MAHAQDRGIVHRDLKGANVIVTPEGRPKILDFGLAKRATGEAEETTRTIEQLTAAGVVAGTLDYIAPEVLQGALADARSDLWAFGVMLYQALTGRLPFQGRTRFDTSSAILRDPAPPLPEHVPTGLAAIIRRLLAKQPGERYQRAGEVRAALEAVQSDSQASGPLAAAVFSRRRWLWGAGALAVAAAVAWLGLQQWNKPVTRSSGPRLSDGSRPSTNREANVYYERGMLYAGTRMDLVQWRRMLERALELDPKFAAARGQHAFTSMLPAAFGVSSNLSMLYKAEEEARQALRDDPSCAVAHSALAGIYLQLGRKELALVEANNALQSNPNDPAIHLWFPMYHLGNGDYRQATQQMKQIIAQWPLFLPGHIYYSEALREQGNTSGAIRELQGVLEQVPGAPGPLWKLTRAYMDAGDLRAARRTLESMDAQVRQIPWSRLTWALLLALEGHKTEALREIDEPSLAWAGASYLGDLLPAEIYAVLGDTGKALEWLDRAAQWGDEREDWLRRDPQLASIRNHPRFQQMLESVAYRRKQRSDAGPRNR